MTALVMIFTMFGGAVLQTLAPPLALLAQSKPPFLPAIVAYYALTSSRRVTLAAGIAAGFLQDALSFQPLGYSALWFCVMGLLVNRFREVIASDAAPVVAFLGAMLGCSLTLLGYATLAVAGPAGFELPLRWVAMKALGTGFLGMIVVPATALLMGKLERLLGTAKARGK